MADGANAVYGTGHPAPRQAGRHDTRTPFIHSSPLVGRGPARQGDRRPAL